MSIHIEKLEQAVKQSSRVMKRYLGESIVYDWSQEDKLMNIEDGVRSSFNILDDALDGRLKTLDLTLEELDILGFGKWDDNSSLRLIPIWMTKFLEQDIEVKSYNGNRATLAEVDKDNRFGYIAYGVYAKEEVISDSVSDYSRVDSYANGLKNLRNS